MKPDLLTEYRVRRQAIELLSEAEAARLEKVLSSGILQDDEEYTEVDHVSRGVQRACRALQSRPIFSAMPWI